MPEVSEPIVIDRSAADEIMAEAEAIVSALERLPYRDAMNALASLGVIRRTIYDAMEAADPEAVTLPDDRDFHALDLVDGWVVWTGGKCPLHPETVVDVRSRNGSVATRLQVADVYWRHHGLETDVFAYRLVKPERVVPRYHDTVMFDGEVAQVADLGAGPGTSPYDADHEAEELQLLKQLARGPIPTRWMHSKTLDIVLRLQRKRLVEVKGNGAGSFWQDIAITEAGFAHLAAALGSDANG